MNKRKITFLIIIFSVILTIMIFILFNHLNKKDNLKIDDLNILNVDLILNKADIDNLEIYGFNIYVDLGKYELDSDDYSLEASFASDEYLRKYYPHFSQKLKKINEFRKDILHIGTARIDQTGELLKYADQMMEIKLRLLKDDKEIDSKIYNCKVKNVINKTNYQD